MRPPDGYSRSRRNNWARRRLGLSGRRPRRRASCEDPQRCGPSELALHYVEQAVQRGTGDALSIALNSLPEELSDEAEEADVLVLPGDTPLLEQSTVAELLRTHTSSGAAATMLTAMAPDPTGYGRVVRDKHGRVRRIVEERDATMAEREIVEVNTSVYAFRSSLLGAALRRVTDSNEQGEIYLTDVVEILADAGHRVETVVAPDVGWAIGVNDRAQLALAEAELRRRINEKWMLAGVTMIDPASTYVDSDVVLATDVCHSPQHSPAGRDDSGRGCRDWPRHPLGRLPRWPGRCGQSDRRS